MMMNFFVDKNIFDTYELGKKNIIGLRQILKQKTGEKYLKNLIKNYHLNLLLEK